MKLIKLMSALLCLQIVSSGFRLNDNQIHYQSQKDFTLEVILFENSQVRIKSNFVEYKEPSRSVVKNYLLLSFINKTDKKLTINFSKEAYYDDKCSSCGLDEANFSIVLNKNQTKIGTSEKGSDKTLKVFHSFKTGESKRQLTDLRITNVLIKKS